MCKQTKMNVFLHQLSFISFHRQLLQRLLDDRRPTVEMIHAEGERIAATADSVDKEKIEAQLHKLGERWAELLDKAGTR